MKLLSGGNQQKVILARELSSNPDLFIAAQPTRGLDIGAIEYVHKQIIAARNGGAAVLLISTELQEILSLSDRIAVMYEGQFMGIVSAKEADLHDIGEMMAGVRRKQNGRGSAVTTILLEKIDTLATFDEQRRVLKNAWVLIRDDAIEAIGLAGSEPAAADRRIDLSGHVVLPGLVNTHHHMFQSLLRNVPLLAGCVALQVAAASCSS